MLRLVAMVCCGTRTVLEAASGSDRRTETAMTIGPSGLTTAMRPGMIVLADRRYGYAPTITALAASGADLLIRVRNNHRHRGGQHLPTDHFCPGSGRSRSGSCA